MPVFPWSVARGEVPTVGDPAYDALLEGGHLPQAGAEGLLPVAEVIAALNRAPTASELAAEGSALLVFRGRAGILAEPARSGRRADPFRRSRVSGKLAAAVAAGAIALGGATAAAYAGILPAQLQKFAHDTIGAPLGHGAAHPARPAPTAGPSAAGDTAYVLCTAYARSLHGSAAQRAVAFRKLAVAAGGTANITAYCARAARPGPSPSATPVTHPSSHSPGKPSSHPAHPTNPAHPSHAPRHAHPTPKPTSHS